MRGLMRRATWYRSSLFSQKEEKPLLGTPARASSQGRGPSLWLQGPGGCARPGRLALSGFQGCKEELKPKTNGCRSALGPCGMTTSLVEAVTFYLDQPDSWPEIQGREQLWRKGIIPRDPTLSSSTFVLFPERQHGVLPAPTPNPAPRDGGGKREERRGCH